MKRTVFALCVMVSAVFAEEAATNATAEARFGGREGQTNGYTRAMSIRDANIISEARGKRAQILSKRHNMKDREKRADVVRQLKELEEERMAAVRRRAAAQGLELDGVRTDGRRFRLIEFDENGLPVYEQDENVNAAITTAANEVRSSTAYNSVDGSSVTIGLWETTIPRLTHQEFQGRVTVRDGSTTVGDHATHVAGTLIAAGINSTVEGMAPGASISAFTVSSASSEMLENGASEPGTTNLYLSNHSYGVGQGFERSSSSDYDWYFGGTFIDDDDPSTDYETDFGRYAYRSVDWDGIAYNLPYYLVFVSAGNQRGDNPSNGDIWRSGANYYTYDSTKHPAGDRYISGKDGYDNMEGAKLAKNVMTVGSVSAAVSSGVRDPGSGVTVSSSSRGPVDDGRIKPDIYGNGKNVKSCDDDSDTDTATKNGTSMACPNVCGSAALLIDYYISHVPGHMMRASTLKALILHTADDRGNDGPDYKYGWGIMNTQAAADVIKAHADDQIGGIMLEDSVDVVTTSRTRTFGWDGTSPLRVTLCWTDPAGTEKSGHENREKALVNDLNLKVVGPGGTHYPYVMPYVGDWSAGSIEDDAVTGVNDVDNVEQVYLEAPAAGNYSIVVDYAGALTNGEQIYSLVITGHSSADLTELEEWRSEHFGTSFGSGVLADVADYDDDGLVNLIEFGLATSPTVPNADPIVLAVDSSDATMTFPRNLSSKNDYDLEVIWSDNLLSNNWSTVGVIENILSSDGSVEQVESSLSTGTSTNRYFRLRIKKK
ncbi:S8 family serine peptidase [Pontiella sp.]|uniref:S8 family serine peptidase n=1 Tax=Pontiella sp. TaxID=2837462 RepID=UPI00356398FC